MQKGIVKSVRPDKGYFFVSPIDGGPDVFCHVSKLRGIDFNEQMRDRRVLFDATETARGPSAIHVEPAP